MPRISLECIACGGHLSYHGRRRVGADFVLRGVTDNGTWDNSTHDSYPDGWFCGACELELRVLIDQSIEQHRRTPNLSTLAGAPAIPVTLTPQRLIDVLTAEEDD